MCVLSVCVCDVYVVCGEYVCGVHSCVYMGCVCVFMWYGGGLGVYMLCTDKHTEARGQLQVSSSIICHHIFKTAPLTEPVTGLGWLADELQGSAHPHP